MFDNIHKVFSDIIPYVYQLTNGVPMGWTFFSVLTLFNINFPIGPRGDEVGVTFV